VKGYKDITYKYLKNQKKRTILTIFGIILSVALITAIGTIIVSVRDAEIRDTIRRNGDNHGIIREVRKEEIDSIVNNVKVEKAGISLHEGFGVVNELTENEKNRYDIGSHYRYISISSYDEKALSLLSYDLKEGRFPKNKNEIAIEHWISEYFPNKPKIGDKIKIPIGDRYATDIDENGKEVEIKVGPRGWGYSEETFEETGEREYTIVGFLEPEYIWKGNNSTTAISYIDKASLPDDKEYNIYLKMNSLKNIHDEIYNLAGVNDWREKKANEEYETLEKVEFNEPLLRLYGKSLDDNFNWFIISLFGFIVILVIVATIAVIYNSFNISVLERVSQFGLLRTVGATPKQIKGIVMKEGALLGLIGIPIGLICGVVAMKIVLYVIGFFKFDFLDDLQIYYSIPVYIIASLLGIITVFLSANGPAKKAAKVPPLEAVRSTGSYRKEDLSKVKGSKTVRKVLGIKGEIAYKNLRRNRKRFVITVFSMTISIVLFITFATFSDNVFKMNIIENENAVDFRIDDVSYYENPNTLNTTYNDLRKMEEVEKIYKFEDTHLYLLIEKEKINPKLLEIDSYAYEEDNKNNDIVGVYNNTLMTFGNENMEQFEPLLKQGKIDLEEMNKNNGVLVVKTTVAHNEETDKMAVLDGYDINVGDELTINTGQSEEEENQVVKVMGILEKGLLDWEYGEYGGINIITTEEVLEKIDKTTTPELYVEIKDDGDREKVKKYINQLEENNKSLRVIDFSEEAKEMRNAAIVMNIFLYGFVAVIALISSINIVNTISTNLILRTKELAMLKAVGMDQGTLKGMVSLESLYYGLYASIYGGLVGTGLTYILHKILLEIREFKWVVPWKNILIASISAILIALFSGYGPMKRINDGNIIENIKMEE